MADVVGLVSGTIAIATTAWQSSKCLYDFIHGLRDWPTALQDMGNDLLVIQTLILPEYLGPVLSNASQENANDPLVSCLKALKSALEALDVTCKSFMAELERLTDSSRDHISYGDRIRLQFRSTSIKVYKSGLEAHKATVSLALGTIDCILTKSNQTKLEDIHRAMLTTSHDVTGQLNGLMLAIESLTVTEVNGKEAEMIKLLGEHREILESCQRNCQDVATVMQNQPRDLYVGQLNMSGDARQQVTAALGKIETPSQMHLHMEEVYIKDRAGQLVARDVSEDVAKGVVERFWGGSPKTGSSIYVSGRIKRAK